MGVISIHALREEGDAPGIAIFNSIFQFLSTPSARRATVHADFLYLQLIISIHALREEGDAPGCNYVTEQQMISIHALREEGDSKNREKTLCFCFIIHLPAQIAKRCL